MILNIGTDTYPEAVTLVDTADFEVLSLHKWHTDRTGYAKRSVRTKTGKRKDYMHRVIMGAKKGEIVDHINHDTLDNRRCNLRIVTPSQSNMNCRPQAHRKYKGVYPCIRGLGYEARISYEGNTYYIDSYPKEIDAARAYNDFAIFLCGAHAYLNKV